MGLSDVVAASQALEWAATLGCAVLWLMALVSYARDVPPGRTFLLGAAVVTLVLAVVLVLGIVRATLAGEDASTVVTALTYLVAALVSLPAALLWAGGERTRTGTLVLIVATMVVPFVLLRSDQVWAFGV